MNFLLPTLRALAKSLCPRALHPSNLPATVFRWIDSGKVLGGPFEGMAYGHDNFGSVYQPKILGTYERELHDALAVLRDRPVKRILNIGAAEGYYAVGLARFFPDSTVLAFEGDEASSSILRANAERNDVTGRIELRGLCSGSDLAEELSLVCPDGTEKLVVLDIEGAEAEVVPAIESVEVAAHWLVEIHDFLNPEAAGAVWRALSDKHRVFEIWEQPRQFEELPKGWWSPLGRVNRAGFVGLASEWRPARMRWFVAFPKQCGIQLSLPWTEVNKCPGVDLQPPMSGK